MIRFSKLAAALAVVPVLAVSGLAAAGSPGQLAGGDNYLVKNITQKGSYANTISATCNDEIQYSMQLSNTQFGGLNNVTLNATLPSSGGVSTATATTDLGGTSGTSDTVTVNLGSGQTQGLENGTTVLFDGNGNAIKTLPDTITTGVNIGTLNGSTTEFVNFKAKISCPETPQVSFACTELDVTNIDRTHFDFTAKGSVQNATITGYTFTAKNANGNVVDTFNNSTSSTTSGVYHFNQETGTYTVSAQLNTDHGNTGASACTKQITVATPPTTPPVTPPATPPATVLPNTGAGDVLGIFGASSAFGAAAHVVSRRFRRG
jgi:hypothetical protein